jgi:hypothetical protein
MLNPLKIAAAAALLTLSACVTINVYFPAAEAQEAAREFVEKVIGDAPSPDGAAKPVEPAGGMAALGGAVLDFVLPKAHAQSADINIRTPAIQAIQSRMAERFQSSLEPHFDSGALGLNREIAVANGQPDWEVQIRETFARQWIASARAGWWYQNAGGEWQQK